MTDAERIAELERRLRNVVKWLVELQHRMNRLDPLPPVPEPPHTLPRKYSGPSTGFMEIPETAPPTQQIQRDISEQKS